MTFDARRAASMFVLCLAVSVSGCVTGGGGGGNDNGVLPPPEELDEDVAQAVEAVSAQIESTFAALTVGSAVALDFNIDAPDTECPTFDLEVGDDLVATATFDYGDGCPSTLFDGQIVSGAVIASANVLTQNIALEYDDFTLNRTLDGTVEIVVTGETGSTRAIDATLDIATADIGSADGALTVTTQDDGDTLEIVIVDGVLDVTDEGTNSFYEVTITDLVSNLEANGVFTPESGALSFDIAGAGPGGSDLLVVVTFRADTPISGIVLVQVGSLPVVEYQLMGL